MFIRRGLDFEITIFVDPESKMVVWDVNSSDGGAFRLVTFYPLTDAGQLPFLQTAGDVFLESSQPLVLMDIWNSILDEGLDCVGLLVRQVVGKRFTKDEGR